MPALCYVKFKLSVLFLLCVFLKSDIYIKFHGVLHLYLICCVQFVFISRRKNNHVLGCQWFPLLPTQTIFTSYFYYLLKKQKTKKTSTHHSKIKQTTKKPSSPGLRVCFFISLVMAVMPFHCPCRFSLDFIFLLIFPSVILLMA